MSENAIISNPSEIQQQDTQNTPGPNGRIQDDMSIREFMDLLRKNGLDTDAQLLNEMFDNMNEMDSQFHDMRQRLHDLQSEVERLRGDTPLTDQFKTEFCTRCTQMRMHLDDLAGRFLAAKDSFIESAKDGIHKFAIVGKSALHKACASMCDAGIKYFRDVIDKSQRSVEHNNNIIKRLDELKASDAQRRQNRGNLMRTLLRLPANAKQRRTESPLMQTIRAVAQTHRNKHERNLRISTKIVDRLETYRGNHLEAFKQNPSFDALVQNAKTRAEQLQNSMKDKFHDRGPTGPVR